MDKDQRIQTILDKALTLFIKKGFENTSIGNIIDALNMSKGGFYHHFKSKDHLLDALAIRKAEEYIKIWDALKRRQDLSGREKFIEIFRTGNNLKTKNLKQTLAIWKVLYQETNLKFRNRMLEKQIELTVPQISSIIQQAVVEGDFDTPYPEQSMALIMRTNDKSMETILPLLVKAQKDLSVLSELYKQYNFLFFIIERILGAEKGSLPIFPPNYLEEIFQ